MANIRRITRSVLGTEALSSPGTPMKTNISNDKAESPAYSTRSKNKIPGDVFNLSQELSMTSRSATNRRASESMDSQSVKSTSDCSPTRRTVRQNLANLTSLTQSSSQSTLTTISDVSNKEETSASNLREKSQEKREVVSQRRTLRSRIIEQKSPKPQIKPSILNPVVVLYPLPNSYNWALSGNPAKGGKIVIPSTSLLTEDEETRESNDGGTSNDELNDTVVSARSVKKQVAKPRDKMSSVKKDLQDLEAWDIGSSDSEDKVKHATSDSESDEEILPFLKNKHIIEDSDSCNEHIPNNSVVKSSFTKTRSFSSEPAIRVNETQASSDDSMSTVEFKIQCTTVSTSVASSNPKNEAGKISPKIDSLKHDDATPLSNEVVDETTALKETPKVSQSSNIQLGIIEPTNLSSGRSAEENSSLISVELSKTAVSNAEVIPETPEGTDTENSTPQMEKHHKVSDSSDGEEYVLSFTASQNKQLEKSTNKSPQTPEILASLPDVQTKLQAIDDNKSSDDTESEDDSPFKSICIENEIEELTKNVGNSGIAEANDDAESSQQQRPYVENQTLESPKGKEKSPQHCEVVYKSPSKKDNNESIMSPKRLFISEKLSPKQLSPSQKVSEDITSRSKIDVSPKVSPKISNILTKSPQRKKILFNEENSESETQEDKILRLPKSSSEESDLSSEEDNMHLENTDPEESVIQSREVTHKSHNENIVMSETCTNVEDESDDDLDSEVDTPAIKSTKQTPLKQTPKVDKLSHHQKTSIASVVNVTTNKQLNASVKSPSNTDNMTNKEAVKYPSVIDHLTKSLQKFNEAHGQKSNEKKKIIPKKTVMPTTFFPPPMFHLESSSDSSSDEEVVEVKQGKVVPSQDKVQLKTFMKRKTQDDAMPQEQTIKKCRGWIVSNQSTDIWGRKNLDSSENTTKSGEKIISHEKRTAELSKQLRAIRNWQVTDIGATDTSNKKQKLKSWTITDVAQPDDKKKKKKSKMSAANKEKDVIPPHQSQKVTSNNDEDSDAPEELSFSAGKISAFQALQIALQSAKRREETQKQKRREKHEKLQTQKKQKTTDEVVMDIPVETNDVPVKSKKKKENVDSKLLHHNKLTGKLPKAFLESLPEKQTCRIVPAKEAEITYNKKGKKEKKKVQKVTMEEIELQSEVNSPLSPVVLSNSHVTRFVAADNTALDYVANSTQASDWRKNRFNIAHRKNQQSAQQARAVKEKLKLLNKNHPVSKWGDVKF